MSKFDLKADLPKYKKFRPPSRPWLCNLSKQFDFDSISLYRYLQGVQGMDRFHEKNRELKFILAHRFTVNALPNFQKDLLIKRVPFVFLVFI